MSANEIHKQRSLDRRWDEVDRLLASGDGQGALFYLHGLVRDGDPTALRTIASLYQIGTPDIPSNPVEAERFFKRAIEECNDALACVEISLLYRSGDAERKRYEDSIEYLMLADDTDLPEVTVLLGKHYEFGQGVERDPEVARDYYRRAAAKGNLVASRNLAAMSFQAGSIVSGSIGYVAAVVRMLWTFFPGQNAWRRFGM